MSDSTGAGWERPHGPQPPPAPGWSHDQPPPSSSWGPGHGLPAPGGWGGPPAPRPGVVPLRPLGVGELLDGAITAIRTHPRPMLGLSVVVVTAAVALGVVAQWALLSGVGDPLTDPAGGVGGSGLTDSEVAAVTGAGVLATLLAFVPTYVAQVLLTGVLTVVVSRAVLGEGVTTGEAWQALRPRLGALVGTSLLVLLTIVLVGVLPLLPGLAVLLSGATAAGVALLVVGVPVALAALLAVSALLWAAVPVSVLERQSPGRALARSRRLLAGAFWRVLGLYVLTQVIATALAAVLQTPFVVVGALLGALVGDGGPFGLPALTAQGLGSILAGTLVYPFAAAVAVLVYVDVRMRREGLDLELSRAAAERGAAGPADPR